MFKKTTTRRLARLAAVAAVGAAGIGTATAPADAFRLKVVPVVRDCGPYADQQPRPDMYLPYVGFYRGNIREIDDATICLMNNERAYRGQFAMNFNQQLLQAADRHANDMARHGQFPGKDGPAVHIGSDNSTPQQRTVDYWRGWSSFAVGENVYKGPGSQGTPRAAVRWWMASNQGHREAILSTVFRDVAVAARAGSDRSADGGTYTMDFGFRR